MSEQKVLTEGDLNEQVGRLYRELEEARYDRRQLNSLISDADRDVKSKSEFLDNFIDELEPMVGTKKGRLKMQEMLAKPA